MREYPGIQPSMIKQYIYCPVIPWIIYKYGVTEPVTDSMALGREEHEEDKQIRVKSSEGVAVLDELVEEGGGKTIVEKKTFRSHSIHRYVDQAITQYLIVSKKIRGIRRIILLNGDKRHVLEVSDDLVNEVKNIVEKYLESIDKDYPPQPVVDKQKCRICWYRRFCPYY